MGILKARYRRKIGRLVVNQSRFDVARHDYYYDGDCGGSFQLSSVYLSIPIFKSLEDQYSFQHNGGYTSPEHAVTMPKCRIETTGPLGMNKNNALFNWIETGSRPECIRCLSGLAESLYEYGVKLKGKESCPSDLSTLHTPISSPDFTKINFTT